MQVVVRVDASHVIGHGHVMRTLALADELRRRGASVLFVSREHDGNLCGAMEQRGFLVARLPPARTDRREGTGFSMYADWLGASWQQDAADTLHVLEQRGWRAAWLIVDHYGLDCRWEALVRPSIERVMVIDDLADRSHDCDMLLDVAPVAGTGRYHRLVPPACQCLFGLEYALLQPVYADLHERAQPRNGRVRRILIFFGGADHDNMTGRALAAFVRLNRQDIDVDVVVTPGSAHEASIRLDTAARPNVHLHTGLLTLAHLMAAADLGIGAGGVTGLERICLGLPSIVVTTADNQRWLADRLNERGVIRLLGEQRNVDEARLSKALGEVIDLGVDEAWSSRCLAAIDGKGAARVGNALSATAS